MLLSRLEEDDISGANVLAIATVSLHPAKTLRDQDGLSARVGVPVRAGAGFKRHSRRADAPASIGGEQRVDANGAGKPVC